MTVPGGHREREAWAAEGRRLVLEGVRLEPGLIADLEERVARERSAAAKAAAAGALFPASRGGGVWKRKVPLIPLIGLFLPAAALFAAFGVELKSWIGAGRHATPLVSAPHAAPLAPAKPEPVAHPTPKAKSGPADNAAKAGIEWATIPGGSFLMGWESGESDEREVHRVTLRSFQLARTEVTVAQYQACMDAGRCAAPRQGNSCNWGVPGRGEHPVNCVDWEQARAFSAWVGGRLPSEAEWEYAARSGGQPWRYEEATCERAVISEYGAGCGRNRTWPVCSKSRGLTAQGLCDLAGNVWEWTQDWYHPSYRGAPSDGSAWESPTAATRVNRGGSWSGDGADARATYRASAGADWSGPDLGFRPARSMP